MRSLAEEASINLTMRCARSVQVGPRCVLALWTAVGEQMLGSARLAIRYLEAYFNLQDFPTFTPLVFKKAEVWAEFQFSQCDAGSREFGDF